MAKTLALINLCKKTGIVLKHFVEEDFLNEFLIKEWRIFYIFLSCKIMNQYYKYIKIRNCTIFTIIKL
jgi:hypothetical protein